jgi:hypothetical protein
MSPGGKCKFPIKWSTVDVCDSNKQSYMAAFKREKEVMLVASLSMNLNLGRAKANGREPKSCLGQVFNFKLGRFAS